MSAEGLGLEQPTVEEQPAVDEAPQEQPTEQATTEQEPEEDADLTAGAVEFKPGEKYVSIGAVKGERAKRKEAEARLRELEPLSQEAQQLREYVNQAKPYIEFLKANPQFLQPQQTAQAPLTPQEDTEAIEYARDFDLYDKNGQPDVARARRIIDRTLSKAEKRAEEAAAKVTGPVAEQIESQAVVGVLQQLGQEKDGDGNPINVAAINTLAQDLVKTLGQKGARAFLANPASYPILQNMAWGAHAKIPKKATVQPPANPPLHSERAGGKGEDVTVSTQHLGRLGLKEEHYKDAAKRFKPGGYNSLE